MKRWIVCMSMVAVAGLWLGLRGALAQDEAAPAAAAAPAAEAPAAAAAPAPASAPAAATPQPGGDQKAAAGKQKKGTEFIVVVFSSGWLGVVLWVFLFASGAAAVYFGVDSAITIRPKRIMSESLITNVSQAMSEGDVMKALKACEDDPGPLANVLTAGFTHVEEGFDVIQEAVRTAADLETEKILQKLTWISVCSNLAPMLGLLGTVQGMIMAFATIATGAPDVGMLALAIAQALYTTAGGLCVAIPAITAYYSLRNQANRLILRMEAMTMDLIKDLRNVEVVEET